MTEAVTWAPGAGRRCLSVVAGPRRYDVVVDEHLLVADVLSLVLPGADLLAVTMTGEPLRLDQSVVEAGLESGSMILTTSARTSVAPPRIRSDTASRLSGGAGGADGADGAGGAVSLGAAGSRSVRSPSAAEAARPAVGQVVSRSRARRASRRPSATESRRAWRRPPGAESRRASRDGLVLATTVLAALSVLAFSRTPTEGSPWVLASGLVLVVGGFSIAQVPTADRIARLVAPALGVAGGVVGLGAFTSGAHLPVIGGCAAGALVALAGRVSNGPDRHVPRVWLAFTAGLGTLTLGSLAVGASMTAVVTLALGVSTLLARVVPDLVLHVEDDVLLDLDRLSVTSWSPRAARRRLKRGWRIDDDAVGSLVVAATVVQLVTLVGLVVVIVGSSAVLVSEVVTSPTWSVRLVLLASALALGLTARAYRRRRDRLLLRWAAVAPLLVAAVPWLAGLSGLAPLLVAGAGLLLGLAVASLSAAVGRGYRSLWAARLADLGELVALVSVLPLALWAAGLVDRAMGLVG